MNKRGLKLNFAWGMEEIFAQSLKLLILTFSWPWLKLVFIHSRDDSLKPCALSLANERFWGTILYFVTLCLRYDW